MTLKEGKDYLARAIDACLKECGGSLTTIKHLHECHGAPTPQLTGRILRRYAHSLQMCLGNATVVKYQPGWDFDLYIEGCMIEIPNDVSAGPRRNCCPLDGVVHEEIPK